MKKITILFAVILMTAAGLKAQNYTTAIGAKFYAGNGSYGGLNIRYNNSDHTAMEGSLLFGSGSIGLEGLYQYQGPINGVLGLNYFVGGGGLLAFGSGNGKNSTAFALRLTGGLDYKFTDAPIDLSLGFDPFFYLAPYTSSNLALGIGIRYVLN